MSEIKRIRIATISFLISGVIELLFQFANVGERVHNILWGLQLLLVLISIGISAKIAGNISVATKHRRQAQVLMVLAGLLALYVFIL